MNKIIMFLMVFAITIGCKKQTKQVKIETKKIETNPGLTEIEGQTADIKLLDGFVEKIDFDETLKVEVSEDVVGDATIVYRKYYNPSDKLVKVFQGFYSAYGEDETTLYYPEKRHPAYSHQKKIQRLCDDKMNICFSESKHYYNRDGLFAIKERSKTYKPSKEPNFGDLAYTTVITKEDSILNIEYQKLMDVILFEKNTMTFKPAKFYTGQYMYFADAANFKECKTEKSMNVESFSLETKYLDLNIPEQYAYTFVLGAIEMKANMEGKKVETLVVYDVIEMSKDKVCKEDMP